MTAHNKYIEQTINITRELTNRKLFKEVLHDFYSSVEEINQRRLCKWLDFFNQNYYKNPCIYSYTVYALFEAVNKNELFKTQTEYEFEISIKFYESILNAKTFISIENTEHATHLLITSLVFGKYPGMQIRSMQKAIELLNDIINENKLNRFFEYIFVKYENPLVLTNNIHHLNLIEIDMLMYILQGNNIRNYPDLPQPISKKESYILINKIPDLKFSDNVILRSIVTSKIILESKNEKIIKLFYSHNKTFQYKINTFLRDIDFWCDAYTFLLKIDWEIMDMSIREFIDYFEYMKYDSNEEFTLKGRSLASIYIDIEHWHAAADFTSGKKFMNLSWKGIDAKEYKIQYEEENYLFKEITNGKDLYRESDEMKHCAFSYIEFCVQNQCSIWSMKKEINTTFKNHITIEIRDHEIVQISGKTNKPPIQRDKKIISEWAKEAGFTFIFSKIEQL